MFIQRERAVHYIVAVLIATALLIFARTDAAALSFIEDFSTTTNRDPASTAVWDVATKEVRLPTGSVSWGALAPLNGKRVTAVAFSPAYTSDRTAFIGVSDGSYRSTDGGATWSRVVTTAKEVTHIAFSPAFASDGVGFLITNGDGLWRTSDGGATWAKASASASGFGVAFSPAFASDRTVFVATFTSIQKSIDGGATWVDASAGIDASALENGDIRGVAISRAYASDRMVFATALGFGVYRSTDGGATWATANPGDVAVPYATAIATGPGGAVAAAFLDGAYRSTDNGASWTKIFSDDVNDIAFVPSGSESAVFLATSSGPRQWKGGTSEVATGWSGAASAVGAGNTYPGAGSVIAGQSSGASITQTGYAESATATSAAVDATTDRVVQTTLTSTALLPPGTSIAYHLSAKDGTPVWEGPVTPGTAWTFTEQGSTLRWRATLATTDSARTPSLTRVELAYTTATALTPPTPTGTRSATSSIRWLFDDTAINETGFEIHAGAHGSPEEKVVATTKPKTVQDLSELAETELTPNTEYCGRHAHTLRGAEASAPSAPFTCEVTLAAVPPAATASEVAESSVVLHLGEDTANSSGTKYAIRDAQSGKYIGSDGKFGVSSVWRTKEGWGNGRVLVAGLIPETEYAFCILAQNRANVATACSLTVAVKTFAPQAPPGEPPPEQPTQPTEPSGEPPVSPTQPTPPEAPTAPAGAPSPTEPVAPPTEPSGSPSGSSSAQTGGGVSIAGGPVEPILTITVPVEGSATSAVAIVVTGRTEAASAVMLAVDGSSAGATTSGADGAFTAVVPFPLLEGSHVVTVTAVVPNHAPLSVSSRFIIDRTPPPPPSVTAARSAERVASASRNDAFDVTFEVQGTLTPEEFAELDALLITVSSDPVTFTFRPSSANWSYRNTTPLTPGAHTVRVASRDRAGNVSALPQALAFVVPPAACGDSIDNDGDGMVDYPNDPDCRSVVDDNEATEGVVTRAVTAVVETTVVSAKAVATTTVTAAKVTAKTAERAAVVVQKQVLDNPTVEVATERVVVPTVAVAVVANTATAAQGFQFLSYLQYLIGLFLQPSRLLGRRKRRGWGTVYASLSKRPIDLATVRLIDTATGKVVQTAVTDHLGRYQFAVKRAGTYRIVASHPGHAFPSVHLKGRVRDTAFTDLYHGGPITVGESGAFIAANIPLDAEEQVEAPEARIIRQRYFQLASTGISTSGLVLSLVSFGVSPRPYVAVILIVNILLFIFFRRIALAMKRPRSWGAIADALAKSPLHLAVVRLFDTEFNKLLETAATDRYGRYSFLVGKNVYYVTAQKSGYAAAKSDAIDLTKAEGVVGVDLSLKPQAASRKPNA